MIIQGPLVWQQLWFHMLVKQWFCRWSWKVSIRNAPEESIASVKVSWASGVGCLGTIHGQALLSSPEVRKLSDISACLQSTEKPDIWSIKIFFLGFHFGFVSMNCGRTPTFSCWRCQKKIGWPLFLLRVLAFRPEEALKLALSWKWNCSDKARAF